MPGSEKLTAALSELNRLTGLTLTIGETEDLTEEEEALLLSRIRSLTQTFRLSHDRSAFWRALLSGDLTDPEQIAHEASVHHIPADRQRIVILCDCPAVYAGTVMEFLRSLFPSSEACDTLQMDEGRFAIVQIQEEILTETGSDAVRKEEVLSFLRSTSDTLSAEAMAPVHISCSGPVPLGGMAKAWQECIQAMEIGTLFTPNETVYLYHDLGIGKLIWQTPAEVSRDYLRETLLPGAEEGLTDDLIETAQVFFRCDLVISAAAKELHMHRNTLLYRIEQIRRVTGLDIRHFEDAKTLSLAISTMQFLRQTE